MEKNKRKMMIAYLSLASTLLAGCNSNNNINQNTTEYINKTTSEITTEIITTEASTQMTEEITTTENTTEEKTTENTTEEMTTEEVTTESKSVDDEIIDNINDDKNKIELYVTKEDYENVKKYGREFFIKMVDFIFYDKEIKGYTFSELSDNTKIKVIALALKIDSKIEEYIPGYKKSISSNGNKIYTDVKDRLVSSYLDLSVKICSNNEEGCNKAKDIFSDIKDNCKIGWSFIKKLASDGGNKLKDWYEIYSGKR